MLEQELIKSVEKDPEKTAIVYDNLRISYQELYSQVQGFSQGLRSLGLGKGDCIAVILPNCPKFTVSFYAAAKLNATFLPLKPSF